MPKLNAVDAISPAFHLTRHNLFSPFRWSFWWRVALLGFLTGEFAASGGSPNFNIPSNWPPPSSNGQDHLNLLARPLPNIDPHILWVLVPFLILAFLVFMLVMMYLGSVSRFILLEAVLNGQVSIREAWGRWKDQGARFFGFQLILQMIFFVIIGFAALIFLLMIGVGTLKGGLTGARMGALLGAFALFFFALFLLLIPYLIIFVLAKDFAVPVMALEGATFTQGWRRAWAMVKEETGSVLGYLGMKIVLNIGAAFVFGIVGGIAIIIVLVPIGGVGFLAVLAGKVAGLTWTPYTITLAVCALVVVVGLVIAVFSLVCAPVAMFFPSYALYFFAGRYQPLHDRLFPPAPAAPPAPEPPQMPPDLPPEPSAT